VGAQTSAPITNIPTSLRTVTKIPQADANITRKLTISDTTVAGIAGAAFVINHKFFDFNTNNYEVPLNNTEIWEITSSSNFGHPFHIHDVEFNILSVAGVAPVAAQAGWKDVVFVPSKSTVKFIAKFDDYADDLHPFMYHCHISLHEDEGMMGQFVVKNLTNGIKNIDKESLDYTVYPNPANEKLYFSFNNVNTKVYYVSILNIVGKAVMMLPRPDWQNGIDISNLSNGTYLIQLIDDETKSTTSKKFVKD
jgi:bilirubin oxidase